MVLTKKAIKHSQEQKNFLSSNKIPLWKVLLAISLFLVMAGLIVARFFNNGYEWLSIDQIGRDGLYYEPQVLYGAACLLAGFGIPIVGASMQIVTRNKLAEPTTLGFYPIIFTGLLLSQLSLDNNFTSYVFSMCLALMVIFVNFVIVKGKPGKQTIKSILIGFALNAIMTGINYLIITYSTAKGDPLAWISGDFSSITEERIYISAGLILVCSAILMFLIPYFNIIQKDYIIAKSLGINVDLIYWIVAICAVVITVSSMLIIGGVVLLGIVVPHMVRFIFRTQDNRIILPMSGIMGMFLLNMSLWLVDGVTSLAGVTLNVNILVAVLGLGVFFFVLKGKSQHV